MFCMRKFILLWSLVAVSCTPADPWVKTRSEIRQIFELPLVEMDFRQVIYHSKDRAWWNILESRREALFTVPVRIQAGFNLSQGYSIEPFESQKTIEVVFPAPQILMGDADDESLEQYFSLPASGSLTPQELQSLLSQAVESAKAEALNSGILDLARTDATNFLTSFFGVLGFDTVILRIQEVKL